MKKIIKPLCQFYLTPLCCTIIINTAIALPSSPPGLLSESKQMLVVVTNSWDDYQGYMQPFARNTTTQAWHVEGKAWPVVVGKKGLGWGYNFKNNSNGNPNKKEGDEKAPAGIFKLGPAFGFSSITNVQSKLAYIPIKSTIVCVDDINSQYYGHIIDSKKVPINSWHSGENMFQYPQQYSQGIVVHYNTNRQQPGAGSCIFVHVRGDTDKEGTMGCTAMSAPYINSIIQWLNPKAKPILVQLPKNEYIKLQAQWKLPAYQDN